MLPAIRSAAREHALSHPFAETTITVGRLGGGRGSALVTRRCPIGTSNGTAVPAARRTAASERSATGTGRVG